MAGTYVATAAGAAVVGGPAAVFAADGIANSPPAMQAATQIVRGAALALARPGVVWSRPLRQAGRGLGNALATLHPAVAKTVYWQDKLADLGVALYATTVDQVAWADERRFVTRSPAAPYPAECDWRSPAQSCPDPLSYMRAAAVAPYVYATVGVAAGAALGAATAYMAWPHAIDYLAQTDPERVITVGPTYLRSIERSVVALVLAAARRACAQREQAAAAAPTDAAGDNAQAHPDEAALEDGLGHIEEANSSDAGSTYYDAPVEATSTSNELTPLLNVAPVA
jgi:hypothetical protein